MKLTVLLFAAASARTLWSDLDSYSFDDYKAEFGKVRRMLM